METNYFSNFVVLIQRRVLTEKSAVVLIFFKRKSVIDIKKTPLMPFNELLGRCDHFINLMNIILTFDFYYFY